MRGFVVSSAQAEMRERVRAPPRQERPSEGLIIDKPALCSLATIAAEAAAMPDPPQAPH